MNFFSDLKKTQKKTHSMVSCPVDCCDRVIHRITRKDSVAVNASCICPIHGIFVHSSTFVYSGKFDNILDASDKEKNILNAIFRVKGNHA